jgi:ubiquinone/menaquinone biosynthesis C-methylase UbiE
MGTTRKSDLQRLTETWETLGKEDPLWAIFTHADKQGGRWDLREFMQSGEQAVDLFYGLIAKHAHIPGLFSHVLDFGCGVGRLTFAWSKRAKQVTGVDISPSMLEFANSNLAGREHINFVLNQSNDLRVFKEGEFDLVFSHVCLQHMPWSLAAGYVAEFGRICQPGGVVAFQLPSRAIRGDWKARLRKSLIESLPFGVDRLYRKWRRGSSVVFEMHFTPSAVVEAAAAAAGLKLVHREPDKSAGATSEGFFYVFGKS